MNNFNNLSVGDLEILAQLPKMTSIRSFAQNLDMTPSFLSKKIRKLEEILKIKLINRSAKGITTTKDSMNVILLAREVLEKIEQMRNTKSSKHEETEDIQTLTIGTRGFLNAAFIPNILEEFDHSSQKIKFQFIDMSPDDQLNSSKSNEIDIFISLKKINFGEAWITEQVGSINWAIYASKGHPLLKAQSLDIEKVLIYPFTRPTYWDGSSIMTISDSIPLKQSHKIKYGHGIQNTQAAIAVITNTQHLTYIPTVAAKRSIQLGEIMEINLDDLEKKQDQLFISVHSDRVSNIVYNELKSTIEKLLKS